MNLKEAEVFLKEVNELYKQIPKKEKTFMQIAGYPHYENVCSNILAFYLNPKEEHRLNNIVLTTLLNIIEEKEEKVNTKISFSNMSILREFPTENGNRIDIVIQNAEIAIGIENKIMAQVYNDLDDYYKTIDKLNKNSVKILLSLHNETETATKNKFINITYNEFFEKLMGNLSNYNDKTNKWYIYLLDFIKNLKGIEVEKNMESIITEWIKSHQDDINNFYELLNMAKSSIDNKLNEYGTLLEEKSDYKVRYWHDSDVQSGAYILLNGLGCNLDAVLTMEGWKLGLNIWKKMNQIKIKQALIENNFKIIEEVDTHIYLLKLEYSCQIDEVVNQALKILYIILNV